MPTVTLGIESDGDDLTLEVKAQMVTCSVSLDRCAILHVMTAQRGNIEMGIYSIDHDPKWQIRPTMKVLSELEAAGKVKYGKPKVSMMAYRYHALNTQHKMVKQDAVAAQGSLF